LAPKLDTLILPVSPFRSRKRLPSMKELEVIVPSTVIISPVSVVDIFSIATVSGSIFSPA
jgi:hypothetical protein